MQNISKSVLYNQRTIDTILQNLRESNVTTAKDEIIKLDAFQLGLVLKEHVAIFSSLTSTLKSTASDDYETIKMCTHIILSLLNKSQYWIG